MESLNPNRHLKEQFVSNLTGSSKLEIFILVANLSILVLIRRCIGCNWINIAYLKKDDNIAGGRKSFEAYIAVLLVDFLCIVVPYILFLTVLAEWTYWSTVLLILLLFFLRTYHRNHPSFLQEGGVDSIRENISSYRVSMMLVTCLSILAVDFNIFPRRYAKTETYGTSLMDLGVGSFVLANALVSRQARGISNMTLISGLRSTSPLIILGFARLISTSSVNYQVHVGEYGVHWNFFFTLAAVAILSLIIDVHPKYCGILGSGILIGYQALLLCGLNAYLLSEERKGDTFSQNKEGIISIFGYWGMYLIGVRIGSYIFFGDNANALLRTKNLARTRVWTLCMFFWLLTLLLDWYVEPISRRMVYTLALSTQPSFIIPYHVMKKLKIMTIISVLCSATWHMFLSIWLLTFRSNHVLCSLITLYHFVLNLNSYHTWK